MDSTRAISRHKNRAKSLKTCGGQGRNRTADASLFRAGGSITYRQVSRSFMDLRALSLDSIWTPGAILKEVGLHSDSTFRVVGDSTDSAVASCRGTRISASFVATVQLAKTL
jgi:hypothetical protein